MNEPAPDVVEGEGTPEPTGPRAPSATLVRITVLIFLVAVIGAECLLASLCLPSGLDAGSAAASGDHKPGPAHAGKTDNKDKKDKKEKKDKHAGQAKDAEPSEESAVDAADQVEVDLEQYTVTAHQPASNTTMRIEFHLYGVINAGDKAEFERLVKTNQHRLRDQVLVIIRSAEPRDLADAGLGLIKRQISEKTNALLGKPLLRAVIVSEFSYIEQ